MYLIEFRDWTAWLFELLILIVVWMEYRYDAAKDEAKKHKQTRTSKKTTTKPTGESVTEEVTETSEPIEEKK